MAGRLTVCPTPIGNMDDMTKRVRDSLVIADYIACEDTRRTGKLLERLEIKPRPRLVSYHEGNEASRALELVKRIERGERVALVSDAGMPGISDPGYRLIQEVIERGLELVVLPGRIEQSVTEGHAAPADHDHLRLERVGERGQGDPQHPTGPLEDRAGLRIT